MIHFTGAIVVNEVSDRGTLFVCGGNGVLPGEDWIELYNNDPTTPVDIGGYVLQDDAPTNYTIPNATIIAANGFLLFCKSPVGNFTFGIGGTDTITLLNRTGAVISTSGKLLNNGTATLTYQRRPDGSYAYSLPSPNAVNLFFSPLAGIVVVNEVADKSVPGFCGGQDYVELFNTGTLQADITGFRLYDDRGPLGPEVYTFPNRTVLAAGEIRLLCGGPLGTFQFGIGGADSVTLVDPQGALVSATGVLLNLGSGTATYQRTSAGAYVYALPSPGAPNVFEAGGKVVINEVAAAGSSNSAAFCPVGTGYIELLNDSDSPLNLTGFVMYNASGPTDPSAYTFSAATPLIQRRAFAVFCRGTTFNFAISNTATISINNVKGEVVSTTGPIGGAAPRPNTINVTWARVVDLLNLTAPFVPFYQYSVDPTPGRVNVFSFVPVKIAQQACGVQTEPLSCLADYVFRDKLALNTGTRNPELSGGTYDGRTCNHLFIGDEGTVNEVNITGSTVSLLRSVPVIGGSTDTEGICIWYDSVNGDKFVIVDERERSCK